MTNKPPLTLFRSLCLSLILILCSCIIAISCKKSPSASIYSCSGVECVNGGKCDSGKCTCPSGFTGNYCQTKIEYPTSKYINQITKVRNYHSYYTSGYFITAKDDARFGITAINDTALLFYSDTLLFSAYSSNGGILQFYSRYKYQGIGSAVNIAYFTYNDSMTIESSYTVSMGGTSLTVLYSY